MRDLDTNASDSAFSRIVIAYNLCQPGQLHRINVDGDFRRSCCVLAREGLGTSKAPGRTHDHFLPHTLQCIVWRRIRTAQLRIVSCDATFRSVPSMSTHL